MPNVNISSISPILKVHYEGPVAKNIQDEMVLTKRIESSSKGVTHRAGGCLLYTSDAADEL